MLPAAPPDWRAATPEVECSVTTYSRGTPWSSWANSLPWCRSSMLLYRSWLTSRWTCSRLVIEVPKISCPSRPLRAVLMEPQIAEQLVDVPTIVSLEMLEVEVEWEEVDALWLFSRVLLPPILGGGGKGRGGHVAALHDVSYDSLFSLMGGFHGPLYLAVTCSI